MLYTPLSSRVYVLQAISPVEIQPYSQRKRKRISLWGCIERRRGREKNRLFLERRQSQEKNYSFHPERSSAIFIEKMSSMPCCERQPRWLYDIFFIEKMSSTFCYEWQPCLAVWYQFHFFFPRRNRDVWFLYFHSFLLSYILLPEGLGWETFILLYCRLGCVFYFCISLHEELRLKAEWPLFCFIAS